MLKNTIGDVRYDSMKDEKLWREGMRSGWLGLPLPLPSLQSLCRMHCRNDRLVVQLAGTRSLDSISVEVFAATTASQLVSSHVQR
jgi:hypothetical protein